MPKDVWTVRCHELSLFQLKLLYLYYAANQNHIGHKSKLPQENMLAVINAYSSPICNACVIF